MKCKLGYKLNKDCSVPSRCNVKVEEDSCYYCVNYDINITEEETGKQVINMQQIIKDFSDNKIDNSKMEILIANELIGKDPCEKFEIWGKLYAVINKLKKEKEGKTK